MKSFIENSLGIEVDIEAVNLIISFLCFTIHYMILSV